MLRRFVATAIGTSSAGTGAGAGVIAITGITNASAYCYNYGRPIVQRRLAGVSVIDTFTIDIASDRRHHCCHFHVGVRTRDGTLALRSSQSLLLWRVAALAVADVKAGATTFSASLAAFFKYHVRQVTS